MTYKYDESRSIGKEEFFDIIVSGITEIVCDAIVRSVHFINDYDWLLQQFTVLLNHPDMEIRGVTITCIGHLARLNERANKDQLLSILNPLLSDSNLVGRVEDAIDDVNTYL